MTSYHITAIHAPGAEVPQKDLHHDLMPIVSLAHKRLRNRLLTNNQQTHLQTLALNLLHLTIDCYGSK